MRRILFALIAFLLVPLCASAAAFKTSRGNIYSAGPSVDITENASNDIVAAGGHVVIAGNAGNELLAAGGSLVLSGKVKGDARIAGGNITLANEIGGEAVVAGANIHLLPQGLIAGDLIAASGEIVIDGTIGGGVKIICDRIFINGTVGGDAAIKAREVVIGQRAVIKGALIYEAKQEARIEQGAVITGEKIFTPKEITPSPQKILKLAGLWWFFKVIAVIAAALAFFFAFREKTSELTTLAIDRFGSELLRGFVILIMIPAVIVLLFMTLAGSLLGLIGIFLYSAIVILSSVLAALIFTRLFSGYLFKKEPSLSWPMILVGVLLYHAIGLIPFLGWIFKLLFFLSALGALSHLVYRGLKPSATPMT